MELVPLVVLTVIAVAGATAGVAVAVRSGGAAQDATSPRDGKGEGLLRVTAQVHTGWEQTLLGLVRELRLPRSSSDVAYGALYLEAQTEHRMFVRTRSEIGRGFLGAIEIVPRRGPTRVSYVILRLPGDEQLHARVLDFELRLISAVRGVDRGASIHLAADALRDFDRPRLLDQE